MDWKEADWNSGDWCGECSVLPLVGLSSARLRSPMPKLAGGNDTARKTNWKPMFVDYL